MDACHSSKLSVSTHSEIATGVEHAGREVTLGICNVVQRSELAFMGAIEGYDFGAGFKRVL